MNTIPPFEIGAALCRLPSGGLGRGPLGSGTATGVSFPASCPPNTKMFAAWHTHPSSGGGDIRPSAQDIREAGRFGWEQICITNDTETKCYRVNNA